jgi:2-hydroxy-palmitic acid dioxygenase Mpo1-like protein
MRGGTLHPGRRRKQGETPSVVTPARRAVRSVLVMQRHRQHRLALVAGAGDGLEAHQRRRALAVVVADVDGEGDDAPAALPSDGQGQHPQHVPFNFWIHRIAIPLVPLVAPVLLFFVAWYWAPAVFVLGYLLQRIGHLAEGNDLGEWAAIKRLLGLPDVGMAPRWKPRDPAQP